MKPSFIRKLTVLLFILLAVSALVFHTGVGNLSSLGWDAVSYICPLGGIEAMLASMILLPQPLISLALLAVVVFFLGKTFCAWVCPIPPIKRFFKKKETSSKVSQCSKGNNETLEFSEKAKYVEDCVNADKCEVSQESNAAYLKNTNLKASKKLVGASEGKAGVSTAGCGAKGCSSCVEQRKKFDSRHIVLGGALLSTAAFGFPVFCLVCPVGLVFASIVVWWRFFGFAEMTIMLILFPAILLIEILVLRKWCLKFCPLGAIMSLMSLSNRFFKPKVDMAKCLRGQGIECDRCASICEEKLDPHFKAGMHECSKCGLCVEGCPTKAISIPFRDKRAASLTDSSAKLGK